MERGQLIEMLTRGLVALAIGLIGTGDSDRQRRTPKGARKQFELVIDLATRLRQALRLTGDLQDEPTGWAGLPDNTQFLQLLDAAAPDPFAMLVRPGRNGPLFDVTSSFRPALAEIAARAGRGIAKLPKGRGNRHAEPRPDGLLAQDQCARVLRETFLLQHGEAVGPYSNRALQIAEAYWDAMGLNGGRPSWGGKEGRGKRWQKYFKRAEKESPAGRNLRQIVRRWMQCPRLARKLPKAPPEKTAAE